MSNILLELNPQDKLLKVMNDNKYSYYFICALLLINLNAWIQVVEFKYSIPLIVKYFLSVSSLSLILIYLRFNIRKEQDVYLKVLKFVFIMYSLIMLVSSYIPGVFYLQMILGSPFYFLPYFIPILILLMEIRIQLLIKIVKLSSYFLIPSIIIQIYFLVFSFDINEWYEPIHLIWIFEISTPLLLFVSHLTKNNRITALAVTNLVLTAVLSALWGRRGIFVEIAVVFVFFVLIRLFTQNIRLQTKYFFLALIIMFAITAYSFQDDYINRAYIFERGFDKYAFDKSRGRVFDDFINDFSVTNDWYVGRGLNGEVRRSLIGKNDIGTGIENGYLHIILKGGLFYLLLFMFISLRSVYLGLFRSRNDISKATAVLILGHFINMLFFGVPAFSSKYILLWIFIVAGYSSGIRLKTNHEISKLMQPGDL